MNQKAVVDARPLSRNRNFQLLWSGQFLSTVGTRTSRLSYPLLVLTVFGSPATASLVSAALTLPMPLLYLLAGALVDRWDQKRVLLLCEIIRALALGSVAVAVCLDAVLLPQLMVVAFVEGSCLVFFQLAEAALIPRVVAPEQLPSAIAANQARTSGAELAGQPLGGLLFGLGWALPFAVDAMSYLLSFTALLGLRLPARSHSDGGGVGRPSLARDLVAGFRWFTRRRDLVAVAVLIGLVNVLFTALPLVMIVCARNGGAAPATIGWMFAALSLGAIVGAVVAPRLSRVVNRKLYLCVTPWFWSACVATLSTAHRPLMLGGIVGVAMLAAPTFNVITSGYWYRVTPEELRARSLSVLRLLSWGALPLGSLLAGWLATTTSSTSAFLVIASGLALVGAGAVAGSALFRRYRFGEPSMTNPASR